MRLAGIEPTTPWFVAKYSIQLSYSRENMNFSIALQCKVWSNQIQPETTLILVRQSVYMRRVSLRSIEKLAQGIPRYMIFKHF